MPCHACLHPSIFPTLRAARIFSICHALGLSSTPGGQHILFFFFSCSWNSQHTLKLSFYIFVQTAEHLKVALTYPTTFRTHRSKSLLFTVTGKPTCLLSTPSDSAICLLTFRTSWRQAQGKCTRLQGCWEPVWYREGDYGWLTRGLQQQQLTSR